MYGNNFMPVLGKINICFRGHNSIFIYATFLINVDSLVPCQKQARGIREHFLRQRNTLISKVCKKQTWLLLGAVGSTIYAIRLKHACKVQKGCLLVFVSYAWLQTMISLKWCSRNTVEPNSGSRSSYPGLWIVYLYRGPLCTLTHHELWRHGILRCYRSQRY